MQLWKVLFSSLLLPISSLVQAAENRLARPELVKHGSSTILSLRQASDAGLIDWLPQDIVLSQLGRKLLELESHGVWMPEGEGKRWVPVEKIVADLTAFRDGESSEAEIAAVLEIKEQIKEGLLKKLSAQWEDGLEDLVGKRQKQENGSWHAGKAYGAAFLAYYMVEMSAAGDAALTAARFAALNAARDATWAATWAAAWYATWAATEAAALTAARDAALTAARYAAWYAALKAVRSSAEQKLKVLASTTADEIGSISYDLAELFSLLWLTENAHEYCKMAFDDVRFPEMELAEVKERIQAALEAAAIKKRELKDNMFFQALRRDLDALEKFVLAK